MPLDAPTALRRPVIADTAAALSANRARGRALIAFASGADGVTRLSRLHHSQPLRVLFPNQTSGDVPCAALTCVAGGIAGGDRHDIAVSVGPGAGAQVIAQAPEKVYRSLGDDASVDIALTAQAGAWTEWLPQETILFDGARLRRRLRAHLAQGAVIMAGDITVFGRRTSGEAFARGLFVDDWEVFGPSGRMVWKDVFRLDGDIARTLAAPACLGGAHAVATLLVAAPGHPRLGDWLAGVRAMGLSQDGVKGAATRIGDLLLVRLAATAVRAMRRLYGQIWQTLRACAGGLPPRLPQLWHI